MEMQSHSWKREFVSLLTSNSTWICALIFPARLPSVSPGLEEQLDQAGWRCGESSVSTAVQCCFPSSGASSPRGCPHHPLCSPELAFLASHPGSVPQIRESLVAIPPCLRMENKRHPAGSTFPVCPPWQAQTEGNSALLIPSAVSPRKGQGKVQAWAQFMPR